MKINKKLIASLCSITLVLSPSVCLAIPLEMSKFNNNTNINDIETSNQNYYMISKATNEIDTMNSFYINENKETRSAFSSFTVNGTKYTNEGNEGSDIDAAYNAMGLESGEIIFKVTKEPNNGNHGEVSIGSNNPNLLTFLNEGTLVIPDSISVLVLDPNQVDENDEPIDVEYTFDVTSVAASGFSNSINLKNIQWGKKHCHNWCQFFCIMF